MKRLALQSILTRSGCIRTEISNYVKRDGRCVISIQSAVEYFTTRLPQGKLISGDKEYKKQTRYNMELVYIQDIDMLDNAGIGSAVGTTCPELRCSGQKSWSKEM